MLDLLTLILLALLPFLAADFKISNAVASALANTFDDQTNAGTAAVINIYSAGGGVPATADTAITDQTLLAQLTMDATAFGAASNGVLTAAAITPDSSANATGTAAFFRILTQDAGTVIAQGTVGTADADMILNSTAIQSGAEVAIDSMTVTMPTES